MRLPGAASSTAAGCAVSTDNRWRLSSVQLERRRRTEIFMSAPQARGSWHERPVPLEEDHFKLTFLDDPARRFESSASEPVALVGRGTGQSVTVQFRLEGPEGWRRKVRRAIEEDLKELVVDHWIPGQLSPWPFLEYWASTFGNAQAKLHWALFPSDPERWRNEHLRAIAGATGNGATTHESRKERSAGGQVVGASLACPICGKAAKTPAGLRRHLTGTRPYGGHELTVEEAAYSAAAAHHPLASNAADEYLTQALETLVANKRLPKYQFERCVDAFFGVFLPEILQKLLHERGSLTLVSQEFPLKRSDNNRSTNVDYILHSAASTDRPWIFVELKTDRGSLSHRQAQVYSDRLLNTSMRTLLQDVKKIRGIAAKSAKYDALLRPFSDHKPWTGRGRVVYITPGPDASTAASLLPKSATPREIEHFDRVLTCVTFADMEGLDLKNHRSAWILFRDRVVPAVLESD